MNNEFGFRNFRSMEKPEMGIFSKLYELARPRLLWLMGY
jgi:hypothetical protein